MKRTPMRRTQFRPKHRRRPGMDGSKAVIRSRSGGVCEAGTVACTGKAAHAHHILMRSQGGRDDVSNLLDVCAACHRHIHANPAEAYARGWLHHAHKTDHQEPADG